jgi:hypothetical protein
VVPGSANPAHKKRQKPAASTPAEPAIDLVLPSALLTWAERRVTYHLSAYLILIYQSVRCVVAG